MARTARARRRACLWNQVIRLPSLLPVTYRIRYLYIINTSFFLQYCSPVGPVGMFDVGSLSIVMRCGQQGLLAVPPATPAALLATHKIPSWCPMALLYPWYKWSGRVILQHISSHVNHVTISPMASSPMSTPAFMCRNQIIKSILHPWLLIAWSTIHPTGTPVFIYRNHHIHTSLMASNPTMCVGLQEAQRPWLNSVVKPVAAAQEPPASPTRKRPFIYVYDIPPQYNYHLYQYR